MVLRFLEGLENVFWCFLTDLGRIWDGFEVFFDGFSMDLFDVFFNSMCFFFDAKLTRTFLLRVSDSFCFLLKRGSFWG